jgi:hypothetical protein
MNRNNEFLKDQGTLNQGMHLQEEALAFYIDALRQKKAPQLPVGLLDHVENCPHCQAKILEIHMYLKNPLVPPATAEIQSIFYSKKRSAPTWLPLAGRVAASLFVITLIAAVYFSFSRNDSPFSSANPGSKSFGDQNKAVLENQSPIPSRPIQATNVTGDEHKKNFSNLGKGNSTGKIDAFAINQNLEFMVDSRSRSFIVEVHSPINNATLENGIMFSWREFGLEPLSLVILNNRNEIVTKSPASNGHFQFNDKLPPGCYYWKLESANELYYVGKFFIASSSKSPK